MSDDPMLRRALRLVRRGYHVVPVGGDNGKKAVLGFTVHDASDDPEAVREMWALNPRANIGGATGHKYVILDADARSGAEIEALEAAHPELRQTRTVRTPGGRHYHLAVNGSIPPGRAEGAIARGVGLKSTGGYTVMPGSTLPDGRDYKWVRGRSAKAVPAILVPAWVADAASARARGEADASIDGWRDVPSDRVARLSRRGNVRGAAQVDRYDGDRSARDFACARELRAADASPAEAAAVLFALPDSKARERSDADKYLAGTIGSAWAANDAVESSSTCSVVPLFRGDAAGGGPDPMSEDAFHGLAGDFVRLVEPHTEGDRNAILLQFLVAAGNVVGRGSHFYAGADRHSCNLFAAVVGDTSKGRKGSSLGPVIAAVEGASGFWAECHGPGLSSGEGLIHQVRDATEATVKGRRTVVDAGARDKRFLAIESEMSSVLKRATRDGNTITEQVRQAFDGGRMATRTKHSPVVATDPHVSIIGHTTAGEFHSLWNPTDSANGFANRFLWCHAKRSKLLPRGGSLRPEDLVSVSEPLAEVINWAETNREVDFDQQAGAMWDRLYVERLAHAAPGVVGAVTSRSEALVRRLALVYAVLDRSKKIKVVHLRAAMSVWDYCEASARFIFGGSSGNSKSDRILDALGRAGVDGLSRTAINDLFRGNALAGKDIKPAIAELENADAIVSRRVKTGGAPKTMFYLAEAITPTEERNNGKTDEGRSTERGS